MRPAKSVRLAFVFLAVIAALSPRLPAEEPAAVEKRLADAARFLASDALEGRGAGTKGLETAADFIAAQLAQCGLKTTALAGTPFQKFSVTTAVSRGANNKLVSTGPSPDPTCPERMDQRSDPQRALPAGPCAAGEVQAPDAQTELRNVIAVLEGAGPAADETILTGVHEDLHKPGDDFEKLNVEGMRRIAGAVAEVVTTLATEAKRPEHVAPAKPPAPKQS